MGSKHRIIIGLALIGISACSPKVYHDIQTRTEYKVVTDYQHDTLVQWRDRYVYDKGDTVRETVKEYIYKTIYRDRSDTIAVHDTTVITKIETVEKALSKWQTFQLILGRIALVIAGIFAAYIAIKLYLKKGL